MYRIAVLLLSFSIAAFAQSSDKGSALGKPTSSKTSGSPDAQFETKAAQGNMAEVALGKLATKKSQNDDVRKFGEMMVDDHSRAEQDLEGVASENNLTLPQDVSAQQKAEQQRLEKLSGVAFDRAYIQMMVTDHVKDVAEFQKEANSSAANSDLRDYAKRTYPTLTDHLTNSKAINNTLGNKTATGSAKTGKKSAKKNTADGTTGGPGLLLI